MPRKRTSYLADLREGEGAQDAPSFDFDADAAALNQGADVATDSPNAFIDSVKSVGRGVGYAAHDFYDLIDTVSFDLLPDWDEKKLFGEAETDAGKIVTGISQFIAGFAGTGGILGALSKVNKLGKVAKGAGALKTSKSIKAAAAKGAITDFAFFDGLEGRLSDALQGTSLANPISEFLASEEDDSEITGRVKNALEGAALGALIDPVLMGLGKLRAARKAKRVVSEGGSASAPDSVDDVVEAVDAARQKDVAEATIDPKDAEEAMGLLGIGDMEKYKEYLDDAIEEGIGPDWRVNPRSLKAEDRHRLNLAPNDLNLLRAEGDDGAIIATRSLEWLVNGRLEKVVDRVRLQELQEEGVDALSDMMNLSVAERETWLQRVTAGVKDDKDATRRITARVIAYKNVMHSVSQDVAAAIPAEDVLRNMEIADYLDLLDVVDQAGSFMREVKGVITEQGRALGSHRLKIRPYGNTKKLSQKPRPVDMSPEEAASRPSFDEDPVEQLKTRMGEATEEKARRAVFLHLNRMRLAAEKGPAHMFPLASIAKKGRTIKAVTEYWLAALLSGPKTHIVNTVSNTMTSYWRGLEEVAGGAVQWAFGGGASGVQQGLDELAQLTRGFVDFANITKDDDVRRHVVESFRSGESVISPGTAHEVMEASQQRGAITGDNLREGVLARVAELIDSTTGGEAGRRAIDAAAGKVDTAGRVIRTPLHALQAGDELFKQVSSRAAVTAEVMKRGRALGLKGSELSEFVADKTSQVFKDGQAYNRRAVYDEALRAARADLGPMMSNDPKLLSERIEHHFNKMFSRENEDLADIGLARGKEVTHQEDHLKGSLTRHMINMTNAHPWLKFVAPFIKTPVNLLKFAHRRTLEPVTAMVRYGNNQFRGLGMEGLENSSNLALRQLSSGDPNQVRAVLGRWSMGMGSVAAVATLASKEFDEDAAVSISGRGPLDPDERRALEATGWQPYTLKVGDTRISFRRADPFATMFGVVADVVQYSHFTDEADNMVEKLGHAVVSAAAANFGSKSYLTGMQNVIAAATQGDEKKVQRLINQYTGSFVPNFINQGTTQPIDTEMKEVRGVLDSLMAKVPYFSGKVEPRRDVLGQTMHRLGSQESNGFNRWMSIWSPFSITDTERADPVALEMAKTNHPWSAAGRNLTIGGVKLDLLDYKSEGGQTALDRYREISSHPEGAERSLHDTLLELVKSPEFQALPASGEVDDSLSDPRTQQIGAIITSYRNAAKSQLFEEFPEIKAQVAETLQQGFGQ